MTKTIQLTPEQTGLYARLVETSPYSKSAILDLALAGYLRAALDLPYPVGLRGDPGRRGSRNRRGMHSFELTAEQQEAINAACAAAGGISFAQLFEAAFSDQIPRLFNVPWPTRERVEMPWGRGHVRTG